MHDRSSDPIGNIQWLDASTLTANDWNPNAVMRPELALLERSILLQGWVQPILVTQEGVVIDGYHRRGLAMTSSALLERYHGMVPCVFLDMSEADAMLLTVRINRAKGEHGALKMSDLVRRLVDVHGYEMGSIATNIGATRAEVELLYYADIFKEKQLDQHQFSEAWEPAELGRRLNESQAAANTRVANRSKKKRKGVL